MSEDKPYKHVGNYTGTVPWSYEGIKIGALLSIRDELRALNSLLHCSNFIGIPHTLKSIEKKVTRKRAKRSKKTAP